MEKFNALPFGGGLLDQPVRLWRDIQAALAAETEMLRVIRNQQQNTQGKPKLQEVKPPPASKG